MGAQANQVRDDILIRVNSRNLRPGDRIDEDDLRHRLCLSSTPIREALISLEASGVIERRPRSGARISVLDLEGLVKMVETMAEIEGAIAYRAARRINPAQAAKVQTALTNCLQFATQDPPAQAHYYDLNLEFHNALIQAAGNEHLANTLFSVRNRLIAYLSARLDPLAEIRRSAQQHQAIFKAVLNAEADHARDLMVQHVTFNDTQALDVMNALRPPQD